MVTLAARGLAVALGGQPVLHAIDLACAPGRLTGIVGPNGAGKSTLARALAGLATAAGGRVTIEGADIATLPRREIARRIAYLPQGQALAWPVTVARLVALGRLPHLAPLSRLAEADAQAIERAMARADVLPFRDRPADTLSGGERARALIARALAVEAPVLIADEPLASLDPGHAIAVMELLAAEAARGVAVIAILHDLTLAARFCDHLVLLDRGRTIADGTPADVLDAARLAQVYGVTARIEHGGRYPLVVPEARVGGARDTG